METVKIGYERLFNLGHFDHEKFTISKDVEAGTEMEALQKLSIVLADLEEELKDFRKVDSRLDNLRSQCQWQGITAEENAKLEAEIAVLAKRVRAFREKHKPLKKACKCYYCNHDEYDDI